MNVHVAKSEIRRVVDRMTVDRMLISCGNVEKKLRRVNNERSDEVEQDQTTLDGLAISGVNESQEDDRE